MSRTLSRRGFLHIMGFAVAELLVAGCQAQRLVTPEATLIVSPTEAATIPPSPTTGAQATLAPTRPAAGATPLPASTQPPPGLSAEVAIAQAVDYEPKRIRQQVRLMLDGLGGLSDVVRAGDKVAVKVNLTGGAHFQPPPGFSATESYVTHPEVVRALGECLRDAGAGQIFIVEAVYDDRSYPRWGYQEVARALGASLVDLNVPDPYDDFATVPVGPGWRVYESFLLNPIVAEVDTFVSVTKMKCHYDCGVTLSMKNLIGLVPVSRYRLLPEHWWRSALHGNGERDRLPGVILDLNRARPIHLALVDGIKTAEGGEVPRGTFHPVQPGVMIAGKNPVTVDTVATAAMGFDPTAPYPTPPFLRNDNYLNMAHELGLGTNRLQEIGVVGASIDEVLYEFEPSREM
jgi:uncharacterized protein (DUF362 family)